MDTTPVVSEVAETLFSKNRRVLLSLLLGHPDETFYLRQLVRASGGGVGAIQRELRLLVACGILQRSVHGKQVYFQANTECPVFTELQSLLMKTAGLADILRTALASWADHIDVAFLYGSMVRGQQRQGSDVDVMVVGDALFADVSAAMISAQTQLQREINPIVYPKSEFCAKMAAGHHFLHRVIAGEKIFLMGDERALARLVEKRLADGTPNQPPRDG